MSWKLQYTRQAQKDSLRLAGAKLKDKAEKLLQVLTENPYQSPPSFEKLKGTPVPTYSRRINIQHRLVYQVLDEIEVVKVLRMWTHYGE